jgi:hypothetical protein
VSYRTVERKGVADEMMDERGGSQGGMDESCSDTDAGLTPMSSLCVVSIPPFALEYIFHKNSCPSFEPGWLKERRSWV